MKEKILQRWVIGSNQNAVLFVENNVILNGSDFAMEVLHYDISDKSVSKIKSIPYSSQYPLTMYDVKETGIAESIKFNNGKYYSVTNVNGDKYLFLLYDENAGDYNVVDGCLVSKLADKALLKKVKVGMNREEIIKKDSSAFIFSDYSYHRLNDKSILKIRYTKNETQYIVSEISYLTLRETNWNELYLRSSPTLPNWQ